MKASIDDQYIYKETFDAGGEGLRNGIWPRSLALWITIFYMMLFIIRPWEILFPWMSDIHFERLVAIAMLVIVVHSEKNDLEFSKISFLIILFLAVLGLSGLVAHTPSLSWGPWYTHLTIVIIFFVLQLVVRNLYELTFVLISYIFAMALYLGKSQWEFFINGAGIYDMGVHRMFGIETTYGHPNAVAQAAVLTLPILLSLWMLRKEICKSWPAIFKKYWQPFLIFYFILAISSIILTNSRMGMASAVFFIGLAVMRRKGFGKKFAPVVMGIVLVTAIWQIMPNENQNRFRTIWDPNAGPINAYVSAQGRVEGFKAGVAMFNRFSTTGVGIGNFIMYRENYLDGISLSAHNLVGQTLGEIGVVGGVSFGFLVLAILFACRKVRLSAEDYPNEKIAKFMTNYAFAFREVILLLLFTGLSSHNLYKFQWIWIAAFIVICARILEHNLESEESLNDDYREFE